MKKNKKGLLYKMIIGFLLVIFCLTTGSILLFKYMVEEVIREEENLITYKKHVALIVNNQDDTFWRTVYENMKEIGEEQGYYIEMYGENLPIKYSKKELVSIAIDASLDAIILEGEDSEGLVEELAKAKEKNIPVITVLSDVTKSTRECYVGINRYDLGQTIGKQVVKYRKSGEINVCVLMNRNEANTNQNIIYSGIGGVLARNFKKDYNIYTMAIEDSETFGAEETIRDVFLAEEGLPDILICLDRHSTTSACQAIVDYNRVGEVEIIGCYSSSAIIDAIYKNVLQATVEFDTYEIGKKCIVALKEYWENGHVSEYKPVAMKLITAENIEEYVTNEANNQ